MNRERMKRLSRITADIQLKQANSSPNAVPEYMPNIIRPLKAIAPHLPISECSAYTDDSGETKVPFFNHYI